MSTDGQAVSLVSQIFSIALIDLTLSGDNAAVIGLAIKNLPKKQGQKAAAVGALGAVVLRIFFTSLATTLTNIPYLSAFGGALLIWITWKLMNSGEAEEDAHMKSSTRFWGAVWAIIIADISMAFDNVLAVAGAAHGSIELVIFGLVLSIPILVWGSTWVASLMQKYPIIIYLGAAVLAHTAGAMLFHDKALNLTGILGHQAAVVIPWAMFAIVMLYGIFAIMKTGDIEPGQG